MPTKPLFEALRSAAAALATARKLCKLGLDQLDLEETEVELHNAEGALEDALDEANAISDSLKMGQQQVCASPDLIHALEAFAIWQWGGYENERDPLTFNTVSETLWQEVLVNARRIDTTFGTPPGPVS